jgi:hypothetical protein
MKTSVTIKIRRKHILPFLFSCLIVLFTGEFNITFEGEGSEK